MVPQRAEAVKIGKTSGRNNIMKIPEPNPVTVCITPAIKADEISVKSAIVTSCFYFYYISIQGWFQTGILQEGKKKDG